MYIIFHNIHEILGYFLAVYVIVTFLIEAKLAGVETNTENYRMWNLRLFWTNRIMSYLLIITFLLWGYLGTPYFSIGAIWVFAKIVLFIILLGLMGGMAGKALKQRKEAIAQEEFRVKVFDSAKKKMTIFKYTQLLLVVLLFYLAYWKPF